MIDLNSWGFNNRVLALAAEYPNLVLFRVISQEKGLYRVIGAGGEQNAVVSGKFRYEAAAVSEFPSVGDFVMADCSGTQAVIHCVLPRKSVFIRKAAGTANVEQIVAANIDTLFICMSMNNDFNLRRLERYLSIAWECGACPVILLTKSDLCSDISARLSEVESVAVGTEILVSSAAEAIGCEDIVQYIKNGKTVAFIGSSGVGKSSLINRLLGEELLETNGLRNDDKGRHTTTHRELLMLPFGGTVIDTPGMRELGLWEASEGVEKAFSDIEELSSRCRFRNCSHRDEPGCAVKAALKSGELSVERWSSFCKLKTEASYAESQSSFLSEKEKKFKSIAKQNKANRKK